MTKDDCAPPKGVVEVLPPENSGTSITVAPTAVVHRPAQRAPGDSWKWTKAKKEALRLTMNGAPVTEVAERLGVHRNSITNWMKHPAWLEEAQRQFNDSRTSSKFRRLKTTTIIADKLGVKAAQAIDKEEGDVDVNRAGLFLRTHLEYAKAEKDIYSGDGNGQQNAPLVNINVQQNGGTSPSDKAADSRRGTDLLSYKEFLRAYDPNLAVVARSPQEADLLMAEKVLQESNLLDIIREEDREQMRAEQEASEVAKRRR